MAESESAAFFSHAVYDRLKFIAQIVLPALATMWFAIGSIWNLRHTTEVVGTITAIDLFLGTILQLSSNSYYRSGANFDGDVNVTSAEDGGNKVSFAFNEPPEEIVDDPGKHSMEFKINHLDDPGSKAK